MFMQRFITSIILVPLVLLTIFYANHWFLAAIVVAVYLAAGRECWQLIPVQKPLAKASFLLLLFLTLCLSYYVFPFWLVVGLIVWVLVIFAIITFPSSQYYWGYPIIVASVLLIFLSLFIHCLVRVYFLPQGKSLIIYLLFLIWAADVGAYLTGKFCGKHKLIPQVSPGKSWEGVLGGGVLAMAIAFGGFVYFTPSSIAIWSTVAVCTVIISIVGDLFISILKRRCHLKDTGTLIPGHGGVLDRLDSLIAALPLFYFGLSYIPLGI